MSFMQLQLQFLTQIIPYFTYYLDYSESALSKKLSHLYGITLSEPLARNLSVTKITTVPQMIIRCPTIVATQTLHPVPSNSGPRWIKLIISKNILLLQNAVCLKYFLYVPCFELKWVEGGEWLEIFFSKELLRGFTQVCKGKWYYLNSRSK